MAVCSIIIIAGPAGALANECHEGMDPYGNGNASGLTVACTFISGTAAGLNFTMEDAYSPLSPQPGGAGNLGVASGALYHYGAARLVNVFMTRNSATTFSPNNILKSCPTNNTSAAFVNATTCPSPGSAAGHLAFSQADVNRSVEFPTSSATMTGILIQPGTFISCVGAGCTPAIAATNAKISKPLINAATPAPCSAACANTPTVGVLVSHGTNRAVQDGTTSAGTGNVTSATAHFCGAPGATTGSCAGKSDVGARVAAGDLPDGATISSVTSQTAATLVCTACASGFTFTTTASSQPLSIDPVTPTTTTRYISDASLGGANNRTITSATGRFNANDVGLKLSWIAHTTAPVYAASPAGLRIGTVTGATTATIVGAGTGALLAGAKPITLGVPTKTAPTNGTVVGTLAISLTVNPIVSPTSPPCAAGKVSGFHIPWQWRNPGGYGLADNNSTHVEGHGITGTSIGQMIFLTPSTSFAGFIKQNGSSNGTVLTTTDYIFRIEFAPIAVGVCPGTPIAETLSFIGIPLNVAQNPTNTGGGGGGFRALGPVPDGKSVEYTGSEGVNVVTGGSDPTDSNTCVISSPNVFTFPSPCQG